MKSITYEEFLEFKPYWLKTEGGAARLKKIGARKERWTALGILALDDVDAEDKLWAVLREELIDARILHEFACWCAEDALSHVENADERSWNAIKVKRAWLRGEASDAERSAAEDAARSAAWHSVLAVAWSAERSAAWSAARSAAEDAARSAARSAAWYAAWSAVLAAAWSAAEDAARSAAWSAAREQQVEHLKGMLMEEEKCS